MARVLLIKSTIQHDDRIILNPPMGLMYIASKIKESGFHIVKIIDLRFTPRQVEDVISEIKQYRPDIVGFSAFSQEQEAVHSLSELIKKEIACCRLIAVGGPYATSTPESVLADSNIDIAVIGEGEITMAGITRLLEKKTLSEIYNLKGIAFARNDKVIVNQPVDPDKNIDALPLPAWDLIDIGKYSEFPRFSNLQKRRYMPVFTSRSCPYNCIYCHNIFGKGFRARSPESVLKEMKVLIENYGIREFEIIDDIFNLDYDRAERICELIIQQNWNIKIAFPNGLRCDLLDENLIAKLKQAGTYYIGVAVETASPRLQKMIRKNLDLDKVKSAIALAGKYKIVTVGYFMLGFPTETESEIRATSQFACNSTLNYASFFSVTPFKGTELWQMCRDQIEPCQHINFLDYHRTENNFSTLSDTDFKKLKKTAYRQFYKTWYKRILFSGAFRSIRLDQAVSAFFKRAFR